MLPTPADETVPETDFYRLLVGCLPSLRQQARALTRNRPDADDLVQASVTNALAAKGSFEEGSNLRGWLSCIMRNRFLSDIRKRRLTCSVDDIPEMNLAVPPAQEDNLALGELRYWLGRLPAKQRMALVMVALQGMTYEEVGETLGVPVGTLKCRVFRGRRLLKGWLLGKAALPAPARRLATREGAFRTARSRAGRVSSPRNAAAVHGP